MLPSCPSRFGTHVDHGVFAQNVHVPVKLVQFCFLILIFRQYSDFI